MAVLTLIAALFAPIALARPLPEPKIVSPNPALTVPVGTRYGRQVEPLQRVPSVTTVVPVAEFDFEDSLGGADPQGWRSLDLTASIDTFFHIDDFAGMSPPYQPLSGQQSLWCGTRGGSVYCGGGGTFPGYGNDWNQGFESIEFPVTGSVTVSYLARFDMELDYDFAYAEFLDKNGVWQAADTLSGTGSGSRGFTIPPTELSNTVRLRFRFVSDDVYSDEDGLLDTNGALVIDDLAVSDSLGLVDFQDFEGGAVGDHRTPDGHWSAVPRPAFGDYAGLESGASVLQEDSTSTNTSHLWAFFHGSPDTYACGGHPELPSVPSARIIDGKNVGINNVVYSPWIDITRDKNGVPYAPEEIFSYYLAFDLYMDQGGIFYIWHVRSKVGACTGPWKNLNLLYFPMEYRKWMRVQHEIGGLIEPGATEVQVAIGVYDYHAYNNPCFSQAPYFDNVTLMPLTAVDTFVVTNTDTTGIGSLDDALTRANEFSTYSRILFDIPGSGPFTIPSRQGRSYTLSKPGIIDGTTQPGYAGTPLIGISATWPSHDGLVVSAPGSTVRGLAVTGFFSSGSYIINSGIVLAAANDSVLGCQISGNQQGLWIVSPGNCKIGGVAPGEGNLIASNTDNGVVVESVGATIRGNSIVSNGLEGISLAPGTTPNDTLDTDVGNNNLQNYPVLIMYDPQSSSVLGYLSSTPNTVFDLDFYANSACDNTGFGEGELYLGTARVTTDANGWVPFTAPVSPLQGRPFLTATATDPGGNTSEFSACVDSSYAPLVVTNDRDDGSSGCLRSVLANAQNLFPSQSVTIGFDIPGGGVHVIQLVAGDLTLHGRHVLDATSQAGYAGSPVVYIDGGALNMQAGAAVEGLGILHPGSAAASIVISGDSVRVQRCVIGVDAAGAPAGPTVSGVDGIRVNSGSDILIGGSAGEGNEIAHSTGAGVTVHNPLSQGVSIRGNLIHDNPGLSIDLGNPPNDLNDSDTGPNGLQNYPNVADAWSDGTHVYLMGSIASVPGQMYDIDLYWSEVCGGLNWGQSHGYLGTLHVPNGDFEAFFAAPLPAGSMVSATATSSGGSTSQFSACEVTKPAYAVTTTASSGVGSLAEALALADASTDYSYVYFDLPGPGPFTIPTPSSPPVVNETLIIDGYSQSGAHPNTADWGQPGNADIRVELTGNGTSPYAMEIRADGYSHDAIIRGLAFNGYKTSCLLFSGNASDVFLYGCYLGTDVTGMFSGSGTSGDGVTIAAGPITIGGVRPEQRNLISGNSGYGVRVAPGGGVGLYGNLIGTDMTGQGPLPNGLDGVRFETFIDGQVGSWIKNSGNIIAFNGGSGVVVEEPPGSGTKIPILGNHIFANGGLGIDLGMDGVNPNDPGDVDTGANYHLNFPDLVSALDTSGVTVVAGSLATDVNGSYLVELFASSGCDGSGYGEGERLVGSVLGTTDANGVFEFVDTLDVGVDAGQYITATATWVSLFTNGTIASAQPSSEFSQCIVVANTPSGGNVSVTPTDSTTGTTPVVVTFDNVITPGVTTLWSGSVPTAPGSFVAAGTDGYHVETTASWSGLITLCFSYDESLMMGSEANARVLHWDSSLPTPAWVDVTSSVDTVSNIVCGTVASLSPFLLGVGSATGIADPLPTPAVWALHANYPNPFNPATTIVYDVPYDGERVTLSIYTVSGALVRHLVDRVETSGRKRVMWHGLDERGRRVATGIYYYRLEAGSFAQTRKMVLLR